MNIAVIQAHNSDLIPHDSDASHYVVAPLLASKVFDSVIIAAPEDEQNREFRGLAEQWGIQCYLGSERDVIERIRGALAQVDAKPQDVMCRILLNRFYVDTALLSRMIRALRRDKADCIVVPYDFDINFTGDILTVEAFSRVDFLLATAQPHWRFRPWLFPELHPESFRCLVYEDVPEYPASRLKEIREASPFAERDCGSYTLFTYDFLVRFLNSSDVVLDIACGLGHGTAQLATYCKEVHGGDYCKDVIEDARKTHRQANLKFSVQDAASMTYASDTFDAVVSSNTLEHLPDDNRALSEFHRVCKPGGRLIVEVPILRRRPFNFPIVSSHLREYNKESFLQLLAKQGFIQEQLFGMNRGVYLEWARAREAVLVVARSGARAN
jgi:SAM-dependent methyltransferase